MIRRQFDGKIPKDLYKRLREEHKCIGCGRCCHCSPIVVSPKDIKVMAFHLGMDPREFKRQYTEVYPGKPGISHFKQENPCAFLDENNRCKIYSARPDICRTYPLSGGRRIPIECETLNGIVDKLMIETKKGE